MITSSQFKIIGSGNVVENNRAMAFDCHWKMEVMDSDEKLLLRHKPSFFQIDNEDLLRACDIAFSIHDTITVYDKTLRIMTCHLHPHNERALAFELQGFSWVSSVGRALNTTPVPSLGTGLPKFYLTLREVKMTNGYWIVLQFVCSLNKYQMLRND